MASRSINDLHPCTRKKVRLFLKYAKDAGIDVLIYCTYRSPEEQHVLYMQGRLDEYGITTDDLNRVREEIGLYPISEKEANRIVTNAKPWESFHQYGLAFDCVPLQGGKPDWDNTVAYSILGDIALKVGLTWGGTWENFKEYPHFQDDETYEHILTIYKKHHGD